MRESSRNAVSLVLTAIVAMCALVVTGLVGMTVFGRRSADGTVSRLAIMTDRTRYPGTLHRLPVDPLDEQIRRAVRGKRARFVSDAEILQLPGGVLHHLPIALAAHHDADRRRTHVVFAPALRERAILAVFRCEHTACFARIPLQYRVARASRGARVAPDSRPHCTCAARLSRTGRSMSRANLDVIAAASLKNRNVLR